MLARSNRMRAAAAVLALGAVAACSGERAAPPDRFAADGVEVVEPSASALGLTPPGIRVAVKGDWGAGTRAQRAVTRRMCAVRQGSPFKYVLTTGDNFYSPDGAATRANYSEPEACLRAHAGHAWRATWGNHDVRGTATRTALRAPRYYTWSAAGVDFFGLDSNAAGSRTQREWLRGKLEGSTAAVKIAYFHHPPYTASTHPPDNRVRQNWVPLFERYGVRLVLSGHNHLYEHHRTGGVHYVVTGGGGRSLYPCGSRPPTLVKCASRYHFLLVEVRGPEVSVQAVHPSGETLDSFRFVV